MFSLPVSDSMNDNVFLSELESNTFKGNYAFNDPTCALLSCTEDVYLTLAYVIQYQYSLSNK